MKPVRVLSAATLSAAAVVLVACSVLMPEPRATRLPTDEPSPQSSLSVTSSPVPGATTRPTPVQATECRGRPVVLTSGSPGTTLTGDCPDVQVQGSDLAVDLTGATVHSVLIAGDRVTLRAGEVDTLTVQGNDTVVAAAGIAAAVVRGDRNTVVAVDGVGSVVVQGNDNTVRGHVDRISDEGGRNTLG